MAGINVNGIGRNPYADSYLTSAKNRRNTTSKDTFVNAVKKVEESKNSADTSNGEIVVALIGDEATVKTFYKEKDHIRLQPENHTMDPIIVPDCRILGKVAGVFRKM